MSSLTLTDGATPFEVTVLESTPSSRVVLFAVGAGGNPQRHLPLLTVLVESGCSVIAPHFDRLVSYAPTEGELLLRARRLGLALDAIAPSGSEVAGIGHSIGAATLLAMAGGQMWLREGRRVDIAPDSRLARLVLLAPPTGFFQVDGALDSVNTPILAWAGTQDTLTPPIHVERLASAMHGHSPVDARLTEGAGHFSFMNLPPPHSVEPLPDRNAFLDELAVEIGKFLIA